MTNSFDEDFDSLVPDKAYVKLGKLEEGQHLYRVLTKPIAGIIQWKDGKPIRYRKADASKHSIDPEKPPQTFVAMYVWDYDNEGLFILEARQMGILKSLKKIRDDGMDDFTQFDLKLLKIGNGKTARYSVTAAAKSPIAKDIQKAFATNPIRLDALFEGKDPWGTAHESTYQEPAPSVFDTPLEKLREMLEVEGVETAKLPNFLDHLVAKHKKPFDKVVDSALLLFSDFKKKFSEYLSKPDQSQMALA